MTSTAVASRILSRRDLQFLLFEWLDIAKLGERPRYAGQTDDVYADVLDLAERLATELFAPHNRTSDHCEPHLADGRVALPREVGEALRAYAEASFMGIAADESLGGMQLPFVLAAAVAGWFHAANTSATAYAMLTTAAANMLAATGSKELVQRWVPPLLTGRYFGTMCLSEPHAGSSLADISTRAEPRGDGSYRLFGTKMWISGAEHELAENIVHMVLARATGGPAGVKGISLFVVPRYLVDDQGEIDEANDVVLAGLNHKMGCRGTVNGVLGLGEGEHRPSGDAGAVGYLVGEPNQGLAHMFRMMNEARIAIGIAATAIGYTAYLKSLQYARERPQGRTAADRDPASPQVPIIAHADVRRMLLAEKAYVEGAMALVLYCGRLQDDIVSLEGRPEREAAADLLEILTPIAKSWPSQWCLMANDIAIQVHGGYGYSQEYDVEQHYRDNRLNPIHEGTHGIQAIDLLGRKASMKNGAATRQLFKAMRAAIARGEHADGDAAILARTLRASVQRLDTVTARAMSAADREAVLANATPYLEATGHVVIAWMWLEQFLAAGGRNGTFYEGKRQAARFFFGHELPKADLLLDVVDQLDRTALDMRDDWF